MTFDRGRYGFRYACSMPGCDASVVVWSDAPHKTPGTYSPPPPWHVEYGGVWCAEHWPAVEQFREETRAWSAQQRDHHRPCHEKVNRVCTEWEAANPRPVAPWETGGGER